MLETNSYNNLARESNKFYDYYDYYYEAFGPPRVIDLDKYDLGEEDNEVFSNEDVPGRREIELEQNVSFYEWAVINLICNFCFKMHGITCKVELKDMPESSIIFRL